MNEKSSIRILDSFSFNRKFKTCPEPCRRIQNPKFVGFFAIVVTFVLCGAVADAQQPKKFARIGYLSMRSAPSEREEAFKQGLSEFGLVNGENVQIEYRWAKGKTELLPQLAAELVRLKVDVIVVPATVAIEAVKKATHRCADCPADSCRHRRSKPADRGPRATRSPAGHCRPERFYGSRRFDVLRTENRGVVLPRRLLRRQNLKRRETSRAPGRAAKDFRNRDQS